MRILAELLLLAFPVMGIVIVVKLFFKKKGRDTNETIINLKKK